MLIRFLSRSRRSCFGPASVPLMNAAWLLSPTAQPAIGGRSTPVTLRIAGGGTADQSAAGEAASHAASQSVAVAAVPATGSAPLTLLLPDTALITPQSAAGSGPLARSEPDAAAAIIPFATALQQAIGQAANAQAATTPQTGEEGPTLLLPISPRLIAPTPEQLATPSPALELPEDLTRTLPKTIANGADVRVVPAAAEVAASAPAAAGAAAVEQPIAGLPIGFVERPIESLVAASIPARIAATSETPPSSLAAPAIETRPQPDRRTPSETVATPASASPPAEYAAVSSPRLRPERVDAVAGPTDVPAEPSEGAGDRADRPTDPIGPQPIADRSHRPDDAAISARLPQTEAVLTHRTETTPAADALPSEVSTTQQPADLAASVPQPSAPTAFLQSQPVPPLRRPIESSTPEPRRVVEPSTASVREATVGTATESDRPAPDDAASQRTESAPPAVPRDAGPFAAEPSPVASLPPAPVPPADRSEAASSPDRIPADAGDDESEHAGPADVVRPSPDRTSADAPPSPTAAPGYADAADAADAAVTADAAGPADDVDPTVPERGAADDPERPARGPEAPPSSDLQPATSIADRAPAQPSADPPPIAASAAAPLEAEPSAAVTPAAASVPGPTVTAATPEAVEPVATRADAPIEAADMASATREASRIGSAAPVGRAPAATFAGLSDQIASAMEQAIAQRPKPLRMTLDPPELGSLAIEIVERNGRVEIRIEADASATERLLRDHAEPLRELARQALPNFEGGVDVQVGGRERQSDSDDDRSDDRDRDTLAESPDEQPTTRRPKRPGSSRLDIQA